MKAFLFPGQGSQRVGMGEGLFERFAKLTAEADSILGYSIAELCLKDPDRNLTKTQFTQPALFVVNALTARAHAADSGETADFVAGHSVGEYNALEWAGVVSFADGLRLVQRRGALMATAPKGTMAAVIGLPADRIRAILSEHGLTAIDVANFNSDKQTIISGLEADIRAAQPVFEKNDGMYVPLNVSGAFHSRYMAGVQDELRTFIEGIAFTPPKIPVIANVDARPYAPERIVDTLARQLTAPVLWQDSVDHMLDRGVTEFIELGPGDVLTKLVRTIRAAHVAKPVEPAATPAVAPPAARTSQPAPAPLDSGDPEQVVAAWNGTHPVGTPVRVQGYDAPLKTRTPALVLFGHRAAIYMEGYNGYFALDEVEAA